MPHPVRVFGRSSEIHRFAFMYGLSGEIRARDICVEGDAGSLPLVSKFKQRCIPVMPEVCQYFLAFAGACVLCMQGQIFPCICVFGTNVVCIH